MHSGGFPAYDRLMRRLVAVAAAVCTAAALCVGGAGPATGAGILEGAFAWPGYSNSAFGGTLCPCEPIPYNNFPGGPSFIAAGAVELDKWIAAHTDVGAPIVVAGHSEGGQVIYAWIDAHADDPAPAPVRFVSFGNPERTYGGIQARSLPADEPYLLTDVARQYDGAADWPTDTTNGLAVLNAIAGLLFVHPFYADVNLDDPRNAVWTEGNITYVLAPTDTLPLLMPIAWLGPQTIAALDATLRPPIEAAYTRPVPFPTTTTTTTTAAAITSPIAAPTAAVATRSAPTATVAPTAAEPAATASPAPATKPGRRATPGGTAAQSDTRPDVRHERKQQPWHARSENHPTATQSPSAPTATRTRGTPGLSGGQPDRAEAATGRPRTK